MSEVDVSVAVTCERRRLASKMNGNEAMDPDKKWRVDSTTVRSTAKLLPLLVLSSYYLILFISECDAEHR